jgi:hypothetical protein
MGIVFKINYNLYNSEDHLQNELDEKNFPPQNPQNAQLRQQKLAAIDDIKTALLAYKVAITNESGEYIPHRTLSSKNAVSKHFYIFLNIHKYYIQSLSRPKLSLLR